MGKHPRVTALMTGISNIRPPQPKYCTSWDVEDVLNQLRTWPQNELLSPKQLTFTLVMLVSLIAINRGSEIHKLDTRFMSITKTKAVCFIGKSNTHGEGRKPQQLNFMQDQKNQVCAQWQHYMTIEDCPKNGDMT